MTEATSRKKQTRHSNDKGGDERPLGSDSAAVLFPRSPRFGFDEMARII